jgi:hypothetical protein
LVVNVRRLVAGAASDVTRKIAKQPRHFRVWHEPSVPPAARVGPEVGVELPMPLAEPRLSAMEGRPSVAGKPSSRQPVTPSRQS